MAALSVSNPLQPSIRLSQSQTRQQPRCHFQRRPHHRRFLSRGSPPALSSIFLRAAAPLPSLSIEAAKSSFNSSPGPQDIITNNSPNEPTTPKTLIPSSASSDPLLSFLKFPLCIAVAATALIFSRFTLRPLPALAEPTATTTSAPAPTATETTPTPTPTLTPTPLDENEDDSEDDEEPMEEEERAEQEELKKKSIKLEEHITTHPDDVESVKALLDVKMQQKNHPEIARIASRLIELQPDEPEWRLLKGHMYCFMGELEPAKSEFETIIQRNPDVVEAYHGLVMAASRDFEGNEEKSSETTAAELEEVEKRIRAAIEDCSREKKGNKVREFKLLVGQIRVVEGDYEAALKVYQELEKEEPRDFRPYLCQGIVYTLMRKKGEAKKQFEKYRRYVPKENQFGQLFEDSVKGAESVKR